MGVGVQVFNDDGVLTLSADLKNPVLKVASNANVIAADISLNSLIGQMININYKPQSPDTCPIVAIRPSDKTAFVGRSEPLSDGSYNYFFLTLQPVSSSIPYWIFDDPPVPTGYSGLDIYDAYGNLTFSLERNPLRTVEVAQGNASPAISNHTFVSGRTYAAAFGKMAIFSNYNSENNQTTEFYHSVLGITNGIRLSTVINQTYTNDVSTSDFQFYSMLFIDVTNY